MVAQTLQIFGDHQVVDGAIHMLFIHGDIRGKVFFDLVEIIVHHIVPGNHVRSQNQVLPDIGLDGIVHHFLRGLGHIRNVGQRGRDAVLLDVRGDLRDICGGVADAFDIRDHLDGRGYFPKVARHGLLAQKQRQALVLDAALHIVDVAVPRNNALGQRAVVGLQRLDRFVDGVRRQGAHADERRGKALQLCVERKACVHKGYSFIIGCLAKKHNGRAYFFTCRPVGTAAKQAAGINRSGP